MDKSKGLTILTAGLLVFMLGGCVERRLTINTVPQGGLVELNDEEIGVAPVTVSFNWYGDYNVRISKEGYETLKTHRLLKSPLHDHFPFDFVAQILWPGTIKDEYEWTFNLETYQKPDRDKLIRNAEEIRNRAADQFEIERQ